jgi:hypothetical protein
MLRHFMVAVLNREVVISDENEGPVVNLAAVSIPNSQELRHRDFQIIQTPKHLEVDICDESGVRCR